MNGKSPALLSRGARAASYSILDKPGWEVLNWYWYDFQVYAAAGQVQLTFFQTPRGQGGRTTRDTNFPGAGALPSGLEFFIEQFGVMFLPGVQPGTFGAAQSGTFARDAWTVHNDGFIVFTLLSKRLIEAGPLGIFPPAWKLAGFAAAADATTAGANLQTLVNYASSAGKPYAMNNQLIEPTVSFDVTANWNAALALPSGVAGRLGVFLCGKLRRKLQ